MKILTRCSPFHLLLILVLLFPTLAPTRAFAADGDYTIDELSSRVSVETNAAVRVVERQVVTFDRINSGYIWYLHVPEDGESVRISSVRVAPVDDGGSVIGDWTRLQLVDSHPTLQGRAPGDAAAFSVRGLRTQPWYSFNIGDGMVRCWFPVGDDVVKRAEASAKAAAGSAAAGAGGGAGVAGEAPSNENADADGAAGASEAESGGGVAGDSSEESAREGIEAAVNESGEGAPAAAAADGGAVASGAPEAADAPAAAAAGGGAGVAGEAPSNGNADADGAAGTSEAESGGGVAGDSGSSAEGEAGWIDGVDTTRYAIEADYTVAHRVRVFRDVGELYWRYANSSLPTDAFDVNLQVTLPIPLDVTPEAVQADVMAWGHGPDDGTLEVSGDGTVAYHVDEVSRGNYAEAHVIFPSWWLDNVGAGSANVFTEARQAAAVSEEAQWVDASKRGETWDFKVRVLFLALAVVVMLFGVVAVVRFGRSARSRRALVRTAATLGILSLGAQLFFREPVTTVLLAAIALAVALVSLMLPTTDER